MKLVVRGWKCSFRVLSCPGPTCSEVPKGVIRHIAHCSTERSFASSERATFCDVRLGRIERCDMRFSSSCIFRSQVGGLASGLSGCCSVPPPLGSIDTDRLSFPGIGLRGFSSETAGMASSGSPAPECDEGEQILSGTHSEKLRGFQIVVAATRERGIGKQGHLPWKLPTDMKFFKTVTSVTTSSSKKNAVIMGRHTWESIPEKFRPLPGRLNVILTRSGIKSTPAGVVVSESLQSALALIATPSYSSHVESVFVIGGGQVYRQASLLIFQFSNYFDLLQFWWAATWILSWFRLSAVKQWHHHCAKSFIWPRLKAMWNATLTCLLWILTSSGSGLLPSPLWKMACVSAF